VVDGIAGALAGAVVGLIPAVVLPSRFSLPKDITTLFCQGWGLYFLWMVTDGIAKGRFLSFFPRRRYFRNPSAIEPPVSWSEEPTLFLLLALLLTVLGVIIAGIPVWYYLKAIYDTSPRTILFPERGVSAVYSKWKDLPENYQAVFVFTIALSSILVVLYLLLLFGL
jgi:hypothetical protein